MLVTTLVALAVSSRPACADITTVENVAAPIVRINVRSGDVSIRTWDRPNVEIDGDAGLSIVHRRIGQPTEQPPILIPQTRGAGRSGPLVLAPESFVVSTIPQGPRDAIVIRSTPQSQPGPVVVKVPGDAVFVFAFAHGGNLDVRDYRGGTFVGFTNGGRISMQNVGGTIFAQTGSGALDVADSATDRLRARSLRGNITFQRCRVRQIEASSVEGSIVYDEGSFEPGLARFESTSGDVAIGSQSAAEFGAHVSGDGRVYTNFQRGARITGGGADASAVVAGGGPVVTATSQSGNVYLFDGSLRARDRLPSWQPPIATLAHPMQRTPSEPLANPVARPVDVRPSAERVPATPRAAPRRPPPARREPRPRRPVEPHERAATSRR